MTELSALQDLLARKGRKWALVAELYGVKAPTDLTGEAYADVVTRLNQEPDARPAAAGTK